MRLREEIWPGVKCTNKNHYEIKSEDSSENHFSPEYSETGFRTEKNIRSKRRGKRVLSAALCVTIIGTGVLFAGCGSEETGPVKTIYDQAASAGLLPSSAVPQSALFASDLCVAGTENSEDSKNAAAPAGTAAVFNMTQKKVLFAKNLHETRYPASTTKVLTAYIALKYGNLDDEVTVSSTAASIPGDSSTCALKVGDRISLKNLLYGLMICSGNDAANAIAEHISGSLDDFVTLMNKEAKLLGATNSHFQNAHGYPEDNHYTTAYDLYLFFSAALKDETFKEIISHRDVTVSYKSSNGEEVTQTWENTDWYFNGGTNPPAGFTALGGKTGSSDSSGYCLILYTRNKDDDEILSIVLKTEEKPVLYQTMNALLAAYA